MVTMVGELLLWISIHRNAINLYDKGKLLVTIPLNYIDSIYPLILMLPQSETERLLNERKELPLRLFTISTV